MSCLQQRAGDVLGPGCGGTGASPVLPRGCGLHVRPHCAAGGCSWRTPRPFEAPQRYPEQHPTHEALRCRAAFLVLVLRQTALRARPKQPLNCRRLPSNSRRPPPNRRRLP